MMVNFIQQSPITIQLPADAPPWLVAFGILSILLIAVTVQYFRLRGKQDDNETAETTTEIHATVSLAQLLQQMVMQTSNQTKDLVASAKENSANMNKAAEASVNTNEAVTKLAQTNEIRFKQLEDLSGRQYELSKLTISELTALRTSITDNHSTITREFAPMKEAVVTLLDEFRKTKEILEKLNCDEFSELIISAMERRNYTIVPRKLGVVLISAGKEIYRNEEAGDFNVSSEEVQKLITENVDKKGVLITHRLVNFEFLPNNLILLLIV